MTFITLEIDKQTDLQLFISLAQRLGINYELKQMQLETLKNDLQEAFADVRAMQNNAKKEQTLTEFLDEL